MTMVISKHFQSFTETLHLFFKAINWTMLILNAGWGNTESRDSVNADEERPARLLVRTLLYFDSLTIILTLISVHYIDFNKRLDGASALVVWSISLG